MWDSEPNIEANEKLGLQLELYNSSPGTDTMWQPMFEASTISGTISFRFRAPINRMFIVNSSERMFNAWSTPSYPYDEKA